MLRRAFCSLPLSLSFFCRVDHYQVGIAFPIRHDLAWSLVPLCFCPFCLCALPPYFLHRPETHPVEWARAVGGELLQVQGRTVAFVLRKPVIRIKLVKKLHQVVPGHLRDNGSRRDGSAKGHPPR